MRKFLKELPPWMWMLLPYLVGGLYGWCYIHWPKQTLKALPLLVYAGWVFVVLVLAAAIYYLVGVWKLFRCWVGPNQ